MGLLRAWSTWKALLKIISGTKKKKRESVWDYLQVEKWLKQFLVLGSLVLGSLEMGSYSCFDCINQLESQLRPILRKGKAMPIIQEKSWSSYMALIDYSNLVLMSKLGFETTRFSIFILDLKFST